jgi:hypothetical protein
MKKLKAPFFTKLGFKLSGKKRYNLYEKITLYQNNKYFQKIYNTYHQFESYEFKGVWRINGDSLVLKVLEYRIPESNEKWEKYERIDNFLLKGKKVIPIYNGKLYRNRRLKIK